MDPWAGHSDEQLAALSAAGDHDAFAAMVSRHRERLYAVCYRLTGTYEDAVDALQETLIRAYRGIPAFRGDARVASWLYRIAVNAALAEKKRRSRRPEPLGDDAARLTGGPALDGMVADRIDVRAALTKLSADQRAVLILYEVCRCSYEEIAEATQVPVGTVKSRLARARAALLAELGPAQIVEGRSR